VSETDGRIVGRRIRPGKTVEIVVGTSTVVGVAWDNLDLDNVGLGFEAQPEIVGNRRGADGETSVGVAPDSLWGESREETAALIGSSNDMFLGEVGETDDGGGGWVGEEGGEVEDDGEAVAA
jgi:hypothetical protein